MALPDLPWPRTQGFSPWEGEEGNHSQGSWVLSLCLLPGPLGLPKNRTFSSRKDVTDGRMYEDRGNSPPWKSFRRVHSHHQASTPEHLLICQEILPGSNFSRSCCLTTQGGT